MILCAGPAHASICKVPCKAVFLIKSGREAFFSVIGKFLSANIFGSFPFDFLSFINTNFNVRNS